MTTQQIKEIAKAKFQTINTNELIETLKQNNNDFNIGVEIAFQVIMDILIERLPENEYVKLCETI